MRALKFFSTEVAPKHFQNAVGIFHLQENIQAVAFGHDHKTSSTCPLTSKDSSRNPVASNSPSNLLLDLQKISSDHLNRCSLLGQETARPLPLEFDSPPLIGNNLDEHFQKIGNHMSSPYLELCNDFIREVKYKQAQEFGTKKSRISGRGLLTHIKDFKVTSGWTRYDKNGCIQKVKYPPDQVIVFDTEVLYQQHEFAVMATAISVDTLYVWLSPWLLGESQDPQQLIPLGSHDQVVIGHHIGFDRKRVKEEYSLNDSPKWFMDTMAFHIAVSGMCNQQRSTFMKYDSLTQKPNESNTDDVDEKTRQSRIAWSMLKQDPWLAHTSPNGLADAVKLHLNETIDKTDRDYFGELTREQVVEPEMLDRLIRYCALDSIYTRDLFAELLPKFRELNPHPVTFAALKDIGNVFLPVKNSWNDYIRKSESLYEEMLANVKTKLNDLAEEAASFVDNRDQLDYAQHHDPWLKQLDWTVKPVRYTKGRPNNPPRPVKNQKMPGKPQWYRDLFSGKDTAIKLTSRSRTTVLLLRLKWDGYPLFWQDISGWCFWVPIAKKQEYNKSNFPHVKESDDNALSLFKSPHPDGEKGRCTNPLAKFYLSYFETGMLSSENVLAKEAINANLISSYWISSRQRIMSQMPIFSPKNSGLPEDWGLISPRMITMGAVTRRAVEDTWLTASNAKKNRIGSESKCNVTAPPGYKIIGADVDSEELWIAGVIGDAVFRIHGGTAFGWMTLEGTKKNGTDLHSKSAQILGISRNEAKVFNYGRIYGSGESSAVRALRQFNPSLSIKEAQDKAAALYRSTKGSRTKSKIFPLKTYWRGGTESVMYNQLEMLANLPRQQTPVLGAGISNALTSANLKPNSFMTTRVNWSIQSSGVDYLHLLIASMRYSCDVYHIKARLMLTVHDEVRYLAKKEDSLRAGLALQIANLWTRAMFCQQLGFESLPQSVAFFSAVDFDNVLRKEVDDPCITPTQPNAIPPGEASDISALIERCPTLGKPNASVLETYMNESAIPRQPVMAKLNDSPLFIDYTKAQISDAEEAKTIEASLRRHLQSRSKRSHTEKQKVPKKSTKSWTNKAMENMSVAEGITNKAAGCFNEKVKKQNCHDVHNGMRARPRIPQGM